MISELIYQLVEFIFLINSYLNSSIFLQMTTVNYKSCNGSFNDQLLLNKLISIAVVIGSRIQMVSLRDSCRVVICKIIKVAIACQQKRLQSLSLWPIYHPHQYTTT